MNIWLGYSIWPLKNKLYTDEIFKLISNRDFYHSFSKFYQYFLTKTFSKFVDQCLFVKYERITTESYQNKWYHFSSQFHNGSGSPLAWYIWVSLHSFRCFLPLIFRIFRCFRERIRLYIPVCIWVLPGLPAGQCMQRSNISGTTWSSSFRSAGGLLWSFFNLWCIWAVHSTLMILPSIQSAHCSEYWCTSWWQS